jgi:SAM-dependent methyltransferase
MNDHDISSPDFWIRQWETTLTGTPFTVNRGYADSRFWDHAAKDYDQGFDDRANRELAETVSLLTAKKLLFEGARVLDIGCGTGRLAFALAREGADVVAVDFSGGMLLRLRENLPVELENRVHPLQADWETVDLEASGWRRRFDVVVAHMTPAVRRPQSFLKMNEASRNGCFLKGWAGRRRNNVLEALWPVIMNENLADRPPDVIFEFNLLYALGFLPDMTFAENSWERRTTIDDATAHYVRYFSGIAPLDEAALEPPIRSYLAGIAENGVLVEQNRGRTGSVVWKMAAE